ncbi:MAG TPA: hypothetical protein VF787_26580, partial [Thermoanaerobaculia bacterium]
GNPAMVAQTVNWTAIGAGVTILVADIPKNCGREIRWRANLPLGASKAGLEVRLAIDPLAPAAIASTDLSDSALLARLAGNQTFTGNLTFAGTNTFNTTNTFNQAIILQNGATITGTLSHTGALRQAGIAAPTLDSATWFYTEAGVGTITRAGGGWFIRTNATNTNRLSVDAAGTVEAHTAFKINGGTSVLGHRSATATWNPGAVAAGAVSSVAVTVTGVSVGDEISFPGLTPALASSSNWRIWAAVTAADTITVFFENRSGGSITPASTTVRVGYWKH